MSVCFIFLDGVGIGRKDGSNPFAADPSEFFKKFLDGGEDRIAYDGAIIPTDARLGLEGLPQSATGQTAILTGVNASQVLGRHLSGFPGPTLRRILLEHSIFLRLKNAKKVSVFANAYSSAYFVQRGDRVSASTWAVKAAAIPFRWIEDLRSQEALGPDLTNHLFAEFGYDVPLFTPERAGKILATLLQRFDFVMYEYPFTDVVGHAQDIERANRILGHIHQFLRSFLSSVDFSRDTVILTSDHGNIEDLSTSVHTRNPVPTLVWGRNKQMAVENISNIQDITPTILKIASLD